MMRMAMHSAKQVGRGVLNFLLPPRCPSCGTRIADDGHLCGTCWGEMAMITAPKCGICGLPFAAGDLDGAECGACMRERPEFDWARAAVVYDDRAKSLILGLKYGGVGSGVPALGRMMAGAIAREPRPDVIVPVPLHSRRLLMRRFNQSQLLAKTLADIMSLPLDAFALERRKATPSQGTLNRKGRKRNVAGAFRVSEMGKKAIEGKTVLLVDDVLTTGATASACAKALKKAGASRVGLVVFARVKHPSAG